MSPGAGQAAGRPWVGWIWGEEREAYLPLACARTFLTCVRTYTSLLAPSPPSKVLLHLQELF